MTILLPYHRQPSNPSRDRHSNDLNTISFLHHLLILLFCEHALDFQVLLKLVLDELFGLDKSALNAVVLFVS